METVSMFNLNPANPSVEVVQSLREELEQLKSDLMEAGEQRAQAAEYGLVLLEEKQMLQMQHEELSGLYESTKRELDSSIYALKQVQTDYEKRVRDVENQREQLLDEMETRENALINKIDNGEEDIRQLERKLKQSMSEFECMDEHNTYLNAELDKYRREVDNLKEENRRIKNTFTQEAEELKKDSERLEKKVDHLNRFEEEFHQLYEEKSMLVNDTNSLREQFERVIMEKEEFECRTQEALEALEEEREVRSILEVRLKEDSLFLPSAHPSWADEGRLLDGEKEGTHQENSSEQVSRVNGSLSISPLPANSVSSFYNKFHSTPFRKKPLRPNSPPASNLLDEIQDSMNHFELNSQTEESELRKKISVLEEAASTFQKEIKVLEDRVSASLAREEAKTKELSIAKDTFAKVVCEKDMVTEDLNQEVVIRNEQIVQLRNKLSTVTAERTYMEIEVEGLHDENTRLKVVSGLEVDKMQRECTQELAKYTELKSKVCLLEEQLEGYVQVVEKLERILLSSHGELLGMTDDMKSLRKVMMTLGGDSSSVPTATSPPITLMAGGQTGGETTLQNGQASEEKEEEETYYKLELHREKHQPVQVHAKNHSLRAIMVLREQLKSTQSPLEHFTKVMLERSLAHTARHGSSTSPRPYSPDHTAGAARKNTLDLEASMSKWKSKYMHKAEEISNLRSIMKARATTADVAISSLKSRLEGQARSYQTEVTRLKYQIKMLKKDKDEHLSLRNMYAKRCEDYIDEITRAKKLMERRKQEYDDVMVSLQKTIQRKLELSTELEEYKMEHERSVMIPMLLESSKV